MSKFGLLDNEDGALQGGPQTFMDKLASFPPVRPRVPMDLAEVDAAAAPHGFISREANTTSQPASPNRSLRRRALPREATRHLAIRLSSTQYDRFVAYADRHELTYHEALRQLLDQSSDPQKRESEKQ